jgi:hypothetical protein
MVVNITSTLEMPIWWPDNISVGVFFFLLGVTGAAIMVYLGSWDKLMGNTARLLELDDQIKSFRGQLEKAKDDGEKEFLRDLIKTQAEVQNNHKKLSIIVGIIIYLFVGGIVASILANSMLEAVTFGAGWTGFIGVFGIKEDFEKRINRVDETNNLVPYTIADVTGRANKLVRDKLININEVHSKIIKDCEDKINNSRTKMIKACEDKINSSRAKVIKDCENKIIDAYSNGYADAIEKVAQVKGMDSKALTEEIIESL